ncbi:MlaD family protein [Pseudonocardia spinosispora]|uniref:MlaD family protein n=1 Tax=Pseudonocardia spinosispora TaxID=103441 RepID=UPI00040DC92E|nr:MlaD family protein [Pseudonocardia spinosispora]
MSNKLTWVAFGVVGVLAVLLGFVLAGRYSGDDYTVVLPNAIGVVEGTPVQIAGRDVGNVTEVTVKNDKAIVGMRVGNLPAPLRTGTTVTVEWRSVLGERYLQLQPGPGTNPVLPAGAMIQAGSSQVVVEDLLEALDTPTRTHLASMLQQLNVTMAGHQQDFNQTLKAAGPSVQAVGSVLKAVGSDGQAIRTVLADLHKVTSVLAERRGRLSSTVTDLKQLTSTASVHEQQLSDSVAELPGTLDSVKTALDKVPAAADATVPLLDDLAPATEQLPGLAADLSPMLDDLRPSVKLLGPTLDAADGLLDVAPDFLDTSSHVLPVLRTTLDTANPAVAFLRPYTPEIMGFLSGWGGVFSPYDSMGHMGHPIVPAGQTANNNGPNVQTPGETISPVILPGAIVNQPWADATGSAPR